MFFIVVLFLLLSGLTCSIFNFASSRIAILLFKTVSNESSAYSGLMGGGGGGGGGGGDQNTHARTKYFRQN